MAAIHLFDIGDIVLFKHRGATRTGKIFGSEFVERGDIKRRGGMRYIIQGDALELIDVHQDQVAVIDDAQVGARDGR